MVRERQNPARNPISFLFQRVVGRTNAELALEQSSSNESTRTLFCGGRGFEVCGNIHD
jgi:hypothetical protein